MYIIQLSQSGGSTQKIESDRGPGLPEELCRDFPTSRVVYQVVPGQVVIFLPAP